MGREVKRVPMTFDFPIGKSYADFCFDRHREECAESDHDSCDYECCNPPEGDGWQLWQTVSDGPISPVFSTADELIDWMCQPLSSEKQAARHWDRSEDLAYPDMPWDQGWRRRIAEPFVKRCGWAPSMLMIDGRIMDGPTAFVEEEERRVAN